MSSKVSLTASMRTNLLSLQKTQKSMDTTQERLSTGKKVNTALDNPASYFAARSLTNRSNDLNTLLDSMGQAVQTLKAADQGIEALTSLVEQAKALVNTAKDAALSDTTKLGSMKLDGFASMTAVAGVSVNEKVVIRVGDAGKITGSTYFSLSTGSTDMGALMGVTATETVAVSIGESYATVALKNTMEASEVVKAFDDVAGISAKLVDNQLVITADDATKGVLIKDVGGSAAARLGLTDDNIEVSITAAMDLDGLVTAIGTAATAAGETNLTATTKDGTLKLSSVGEGIVVAGKTVGATATTFYDAASKLQIGGASVALDNPREAEATRFNSVLDQIDQLVDDTSYKGVNLLKGDDLTVNFNETRQSTLDIKGTTLDAEGLGLTKEKDNWLTATSLEASLKQVEASLTKLRSQAAEFGNNLSIVETRQDFTDNLVNTLLEGADKLTLADMNEEGANMLALQTRQSLGTTALSMSSQAAQSVLQLF